MVFWSIFWSIWVDHLVKQKRPKNVSWKITTELHSEEWGIMERGVQRIWPIELLLVLWHCWLWNVAVSRVSLKQKQNPVRKGLLNYVIQLELGTKGIEEWFKGFRKITLAMFWSMILWVIEPGVVKPVRKFG